MPSTGCLLWLLQMALFLAVPVAFAIELTETVMNGPMDCGGWIYTEPSGQTYTFKPDATARDWCAGGDYSVLSGMLSLMLSWLWSAGLGAIIFCLRRIGRTMGAD